MTLSSFQLLDREEQALVLWHYGVQLAWKEEADDTQMLWAIHHFYAEVTFHRDPEQPFSIKSFSSTDVLDPYLEQIDLQKITELMIQDALKKRVQTETILYVPRPLAG